MVYLGQVVDVQYVNSAVIEIIQARVLCVITSVIEYLVIKQDQIAQNLASFSRTRKKHYCYDENEIRFRYELSKIDFEKLAVTFYM